MARRYCAHGVLRTVHRRLGANWYAEPARARLPLEGTRDCADRSPHPPLLESHSAHGPLISTPHGYPNHLLITVITGRSEKPCPTGQNRAGQLSSERISISV